MIMTAKKTETCVDIKGRDAWRVWLAAGQPLGNAGSPGAAPCPWERQEPGWLQPCQELSPCVCVELFLLFSFPLPLPLLLLLLLSSLTFGGASLVRTRELCQRRD